MKLKKPEYISIQEAANTYAVSIEDLRYYAEEDLLSVYIKSLRQRNKFCKVVEPRWTCGNLEHALAISEGIPSNEDREVINFLGPKDSMLYIKPSELMALAKDEPPSPEEFVKTLNDEDVDIAIIAWKLFQKYSRDMQAWQFMRLLFPEEIELWEEERAQLSKAEQKRWDTRHRTKFLRLKKKGKKMVESDASQI
jgi:hypothetical protein